MSKSFIPVQVVDMSKEKDWPASLGMLDWDSTSIIFTKRSLIEFLKYTGTTVDPNFSNIGKLPRYVTFGKISTNDASINGPQTSVIDSSSAPDVADEFKATRRVRAVPGGSHTDIFAHEDEDDALSTAPPKAYMPQASPATTSPVSAAIEEEESGIDFGPRFKPTRSIRTNPSGNSSMANLWDPAKAEDFKPTRRVREGPGGHDNLWDNTAPEEFKPTRRVRQGPGGQDSITGIF